MSTEYSPKPIKSCFTAKDGVKFLVTAGLIVWFMSVSTVKLDYNWQWYRMPKYLFTLIDGSFVAGPLLDGILVTLKIAAMSLAISSIFGLVTALLRLSDSFAGRTLSRAYMELVRNTPLLVQIFFIYFVISIQELTFQGMELMSATFLTFEVWITVMVLYFLICLACSLMVERFEVRRKKSMARSGPGSDDL